VQVVVEVEVGGEGGVAAAVLIAVADRPFG
jgi:hypothetical protein